MHDWDTPFIVERELHHTVADREIVGYFRGLANSEAAAEFCCHMQMRESLEMIFAGKAVPNIACN